MAEASGVAKISGEAVAAARAELATGPDAEQLGLLEDDDDGLWDSEAHLALPDASEIAAIQDEMGCDVYAAVQEHRRRGGRGGRKPGAKNRRSADLAKYLLQFGPDPAVAMMRMLARPADMLAAEMGCKRLEALDRQIRVASELMPYFHGKKPIDVNVHTHGHMTLEFSGVDPSLDGGELAALPGLPDHIGIAGEETAENRQFSDASEGQSE